MQIYLITNKINGNKYVGQTMYTAQKRWLQHKQLSNTRNTYFRNAIMKYGVENFKVEILKVCRTKSEMNRVEKLYIIKLGTLRPGGYNLTLGGEGTPGHTVSKAGRLRMRKAHLGKKQTEEQKRRKSISLKLAWAEGRNIVRPYVRWNFGKRNNFCKHGHILIRLKSGGGCKECHRLREQLRRDSKRTQ